jgi:hypothetical protein
MFRHQGAIIGEFINSILVPKYVGVVTGYDVCFVLLHFIQCISLFFTNMECEKMHNMSTNKNDTGQFTLTFRDLLVKMYRDSLTFICLCIANKIPNYYQNGATFLHVFISTDALHVSDGSSVHHQEHKTVHTASGIVKQYCCLLLSWMRWNGVPSHPR